MIKNITTTVKWRNLVNKVKGKPSNEQNVINDKLESTYIGVRGIILSISVEYPFNRLYFFNITT